MTQQVETMRKFDGVSPGLFAAQGGPIQMKGYKIGRNARISWTVSQLRTIFVFCMKTQQLSAQIVTKFTKEIPRGKD